MDPRQPPQHRDPFSRNAASPYSRSTYPSTTAAAGQQHHQGQQHQQHPQQHQLQHQQQSHQQQPHQQLHHQQQQPQPPYPPSSHSASAGPAAYSDLQRRPSDPPYYSQPRSYPPDPNTHPPPATHTHSRHQSASSISSGTAINRSMPPPGSPQQSQGPMGYGLPPAPRPPPVSVGPPSAFPGGRELPALGSLPRTGSTGSSMSISSMLGGPAPARDREPGPPSHYPASSGPGGPGSAYPPSMHASPRMQNAAEYQQFRRPQTPEHAHRLYDSRDPRDPRGPPGASPQGAYSTPEVQRYGTPQSYSQRGAPLTAVEQAREQARMAGSAIPRPNSGPKSFANIPPPRALEMGRPPPGENFVRREEEYNPERPPVQALKYEESRYMTERERQEREMELREREMRDRALSVADPNRHHALLQEHYMQQMQPREPPRGPQPSFGRQPDPREQGPWRLQDYEAARRAAAYDPAAPFPRQHEYPTTTAPHYGNHPAYSQPPGDRYPPSTVPPHHQGSHPSGPPPPYYESPERQRNHPQHLVREQPPQLHRSRTVDEAPVPPPSVAYNAGNGPGMFDSPRNRSMDDINHPPHNQRSLLQIGELNRKGRISPLPQAVQGAQPQHSGPAGEPGIKSEFGRIFAGISGGIGGISSPAPTRTQLPFTGPGGLRREDSDLVLQEMSAEVPAKTASARGKRSRKQRDDDGKDEDSSGRHSPAGRAKRAKNHAHHHHHHHHHHPHHHPPDQVSPPAGNGNTPFKHVKGSTPIHSPTGGFAKDLQAAHHHHAVPRSTPGSHTQIANAKSSAAPHPPPPAVIVPKPKLIVSSKHVLDSVANLPRNHLGDVPYEVILKPARLQDPRTGRPPRHGYSSTPKPLPWDLIKDRLNCTLTVKVGKQHLASAAREEITSRRALWGTDIYTDDSDVVAACIHAGWIRGEWPEEVDVDMLDLVIGSDDKDKKGRKSAAVKTASATTPVNQDVLTEPPKTGPMPVPENRDLHVTLVVLPLLEKYASTVRFGIMSREFGGKIGDGTGLPHRSVHDGLSFMITGIRWVSNGAGTQNRLRGKARRERIRRALREVELGPVWGVKSSNVNGGGEEDRVERREGGTEIEGDVEISGSWWKKRGTPPSEGDKENSFAGAGGVQNEKEAPVEEPLVHGEEEDGVGRPEVEPLSPVEASAGKEDGGDGAVVDESAAKDAEKKESEKMDDDVQRDDADKDPVKAVEGAETDPKGDQVSMDTVEKEDAKVDEAVGQKAEKADVPIPKAAEEVKGDAAAI